MKSFFYYYMVHGISVLLFAPPKGGQSIFHLYSLRLLFYGVGLLLCCQACYHPVALRAPSDEPSLELHQYELVGSPIVLGEQVRNASGITYNRDNDHLYVVLNGPTIILELTQQGELVRKINLIGFEDTEGIVWLEENRFAVIEERRRRLVLLTLPRQINSLTYKMCQHYLVDDKPARNKGLEGLTWDATQQRFIVAKERKPRRLYQLPAPYILEPVAQVVIPWDVQRNSLGLDDISGLYHSPITDHLLLLSDESKAVVEVDSCGREVSRMDLKEGKSGLDHDVFQPEGITGDGCGNLYVCSEPNLLYLFSKKKDRLHH